MQSKKSILTMPCRARKLVLALHAIVRMLGTPCLPTRSDLSVLQTEDGELYAWGCGPDEGDHQWITPTLVDPGVFQGAKVAMTAGGAAFSSAVMDDGAIYTFGAKGPWYNIVSYVRHKCIHGCIRRYRHACGQDREIFRGMVLRMCRSWAAECKHIKHMYVFAEHYTLFLSSYCMVLYT
jgi:hypothetical protein